MILVDEHFTCKHNYFKQPYSCLPKKHSKILHNTFTV